jgi:predicted enzyme related to lactoylglutathione lyase
MQLDRLTLVTENTDEMVHFYNAVLGCNLEPMDREIAGHTLYEGKLGDFKLVLCPNALVQIKAERNRHQMHFSVSDIESIVEATVSNGGSMFQELSAANGVKTATISDPDQNTIVLTQI